MDIVIALAGAAAVLGMMAVLLSALWRQRETLSRERAEREAHRGDPPEDGGDPPPG